MGLVLMGRAMLSKSLIQFSVDGWGCVGSLLLDLRPNSGEVTKIIVTSFKMLHALTAVLSASDPEAGHRRSMPPLQIPGHTWACLSQFFVGSLLLFPGSWCTQGFVCAFQESVSPVLCKFGWFYSGVNNKFLQKGLCHTQVCCTQSPCGRPLLTCTSTVYNQENTNQNYNEITPHSYQNGYHQKTYG